MTEPRFFIDHGMIHDRVTGKHVTTDGNLPFEDGVDQVCFLLNSLTARWIKISDELPDIEVTVVCTNGKARWLDKRTSYAPDMKWSGHVPTHWHPIADLP
jgi:hypothetical protein